MRHRRHWTVWLALLGFVFAQAASAAYVCAKGSSGDLAEVASAKPVPLPGHCHAMDGHTEANPNLCQAHCLADQQVDAEVVASLPALAPPVLLTVPRSETCIPAAVAASELRALSTAPPHSILFGRFLI